MANRSTRLAWILAGLLCLPLLFPAQGWGLSYYWGEHPDKDRLVIVFDHDIPQYDFSRTDRTRLALTVPTAPWSAEKKPGPGAFGDAKFIQSLAVTQNGLAIALRSPAIGYVHFTIPEARKLVVDVFGDPIGARWRPSGRPAPKTAQAAPAPKTTQAAPAPKPTQTAQPAPLPRQGEAGGFALATPKPQQAVATPTPRPRETTLPNGPDQPERKTIGQWLGKDTAPAQDAAGQSAAPARQQSAAPVAAQTAPPAAQPAPEARRPFFAVPYTFRARINSGGPEEWMQPAQEPTPADSPAPVAPPLASPVQAPTPLAVPDTTPQPMAMAEPAQAPAHTPAPGTSQPIAPATPQPIAMAGPQPISMAAPEQPQEPAPQAQPEPAPAAQPQAPQPMAETPVAETPAQPVAEAPAPEPAAPQAMAVAPAPSAAPQERYHVMGAISLLGPLDAPVLTETLPQAQQPAQTPQPTQQAGQPQPAEQAAQDAQPPADQGQPVQQADAGAPAQPSAMGSLDAMAPTAIAPGTAAAPQAEAPAQAETEGGGSLADIAKKYAAETGLEGPADAGAPQAEPAPGATPDATQAEGDKTLMRPDLDKVQAAVGGKEVRDYDAEMLQAQTSLNNEEYDKALEGFLKLRATPDITKTMREEVLYAIADTQYAMHKQEIATNFEKMSTALTQAMNYHLESDRVPSALLRLGLLNLKVDNVRQAEAYFNILKDKFPQDDNIPLIYYYWGDYYFKTKEFQKAADNFQYVVQTYPDTKFVREASVGLAEALIKLGYEAQAFQIVDYIEKRWPRFYLEYLPFMRLLADVNYKTGQYEKARVNYWTYYNLDPEGEETDLILARLGDIYALTKHMTAAKEVYQEAATKFPDKDGGLVAQMRLAEEGVYDAPSVKDMFSVFDRPFNLSPAEIYKKIIAEHPDSELAPLAQLKLAMWHLWNKQYRDTLKAATEFQQKYPKDKLAARAREVGLQAFDSMVTAYAQEENYDRIIDMWNEFPLVRDAAEEMQAETRIALGLSFWKRGSPDMALDVVAPLLRGHKVPEFSEMALHLALSVFTDNLAWDRIPALADQIELWDLKPESRRELDYALALAYENQHTSAKSMPLWRKLVDDPSLPTDRQAYARYFVAMAARQERDLETAYVLAQDALTLFANSGVKDDEKVKDLMGLLMDVTESSGRIREALRWAEDYGKFVPKTNPNWPALRYRTAQLYKKAAEPQQWEDILKDLAATQPQSLYGRMAASELQSHALEKSAQQFSPMGSM